MRTVEALREKNNEMAKELSYQNKINSGSEELENRLSFEINQYKINEQRLEEENHELQNNLRKQRQLNESH